MNVPQTQLIQLFVEIGYPASTGWNDDMLLGKTKKLLKQKESGDLQEPTTGQSKELLKDILSAIKGKEEITLIKDGKTGKKKTSTEKKGSKVEKENGKKEAISTETDRFGTRLGTTSAKINEVLSEVDAKTPKQMKDDAGLENVTIFGHLKKLVEKGFLHVNDDRSYVVIADKNGPVMSKGKEAKAKAVQKKQEASSKAPVKPKSKKKVKSKS